MKRGVRTSDELATLAQVLYLCAPKFVTDGPLAHGFGITKRQSACLAVQIEERTTLIPEVARILFRQDTRERSAMLQQSIADCT
jgi:hypothetical protein